MCIIFVARKATALIVADFSGENVRSRAHEWIRKNGQPGMEYVMGSLSEIRAHRLEIERKVLRKVA